MQLHKEPPDCLCQAEEGSMNRAESALSFIGADDRDTWVAMGMALRSEYGDAAREIWMDWSRGADSFRETDARSVWKSFKGTGVSIASLYHEAKQAGWRDEGFQKPNADQLQTQRIAAAERATLEGQERIKAGHAAAKKAGWILSQCKSEKHAYFDAKGFAELEGLVWWASETTNLLCVPMYVGGELSSLQMIDRDGNKKFLTGGITSKAEFVMDAGGIGAVDWFCEGYATGLSLQACLHALKLRYRIHVCFSANNLQRLAHSGYVIADNDASMTGEEAAKATGLPFWMGDIEGEDFNDVHRRLGTFRASQAIGRWLRAQAVKKELAVA